MRHGKIKRSVLFFSVAAFCFLLNLGAFAADEIANPGESETSPGGAGQRTVVLKVMTINLRHNLDFWEERFPLIADEIVRLKPDLIGLQEMEIGIEQSKALLKLIAERSGPDGIKYQKYEHLKTGKDMFWGEGITIFSRYPIERKEYEDLQHGRVVLFARIAAADGLTVDLYNTHLHHQGGDEVTLPQARKIVGLEKKTDAGFVMFLTGDMNSSEDSQTIKYYVENSFVDTYRAVHGDETPIVGNTSPVVLSTDNAPQDFRGRIDFIFLKTPPGWEDRVRILDSEVCFKNSDARGLYPSDHLGVMTTVEIKY